MTCGGCAKRIKDAFTNLPGVSKASVDFETRQATIDFDPERVDYQSIRNVISAAGYTIEGDGDGDATVKKKTLTAKDFHLKPYTYGLLAASAIIAFYLGLITLTSDWVNARYQFADYQWWVIALAAGLGIQVTLYCINAASIEQPGIEGCRCRYGGFGRHVRNSHGDLLLSLSGYVSSRHRSALSFGSRRRTGTISSPVFYGRSGI